MRKTEKQKLNVPHPELSLHEQSINVLNAYLR